MDVVFYRKPTGRYPPCALVKQQFKSPSNKTRVKRVITTLPSRLTSILKQPLRQGAHFNDKLRLPQPLAFSVTSSAWGEQQSQFLCNIVIVLRYLSEYIVGHHIISPAGMPDKSSRCQINPNNPPGFDEACFLTTFGGHLVRVS